MPRDDAKLPADAVALALVSACRYTGEDPTTFVERDSRMMARHYAFHALEREFPKVSQREIARCVGAPGKPTFFRRSSLWYVVGVGPHRLVPAEWWRPEVLDAVCRDVEALPRVEEPKLAPPPKREPVAVRSVPPETPARPRKNFASFTPSHTTASGKSAIYDELRRAVENTAKMISPEEE